MKNIKRIIAFLLCFSVAVSFTSVIALADDAYRG